MMPKCIVALFYFPSLSWSDDFLSHTKDSLDPIYCFKYIFLYIYTCISSNSNFDLIKCSNHSQFTTSTKKHVYANQTMYSFFL